MNNNITSYSNTYDDNEFYITENDMADLDLFFMVKSADNEAKIIREPFFYFSTASHTPVIPLFQLGTAKTIGYSTGNTFIAGRLIINAFSNIPFANCLLGTNTLTGKPEDLPPMDLYIINKRNSMRKKIFQDLVIKNVKIASWNFEQGTDTPGRFIIADYIATSFQGIHLKEYMVESIYGTTNGGNGLTVNEVDLNKPTHISPTSVSNPITNTIATT